MNREDAQGTKKKKKKKKRLNHLDIKKNFECR